MAYELDLRVSASTGDAINNLERVQGAVQSVSAQSTQAGNTISQSMNQATQATQNYGKAMSDLGKVAQNVNTQGIISGINGITQAIGTDTSTAGGAIQAVSALAGGITSLFNPVIGQVVTAGGKLVGTVVQKLIAEVGEEAENTAKILEGDALTSAVSDLKSRLYELGGVASDLLSQTKLSGLTTEFGLLYAQLNEGGLGGLNLTSISTGVDGLATSLTKWCNYLNGKDANGNPLPKMTQEQIDEYEAPFKQLKTDLDNLGINVFAWNDEKKEWQIVADAETVAGEVYAKLATIKQFEVNFGIHLNKDSSDNYEFEGDIEALVTWAETEEGQAYVKKIEDALGITIYTYDKDGKIIGVDEGALVSGIQTYLNTADTSGLKIDIPVGFTKKNGKWSYEGDFDELEAWLIANKGTLEPLIEGLGLDTIYTLEGNVINNTDQVVSTLGELQTAINNFDNSGYAEIFGITTTELDKALEDVANLNTKLNDLGITLSDLTNTEYEINVLSSVTLSKTISEQAKKAYDEIKAVFGAEEAKSVADSETIESILGKRYLSGEISSEEYIQGLGVVAQWNDKAELSLSQLAQEDAKFEKYVPIKAQTSASLNARASDWQVPENFDPTTEEGATWLLSRMDDFYNMYGPELALAEYTKWEQGGMKAPSFTSEYDYKTYSKYMERMGQTPVSEEEWKVAMDYNPDDYLTSDKKRDAVLADTQYGAIQTLIELGILNGEDQTIIDMLNTAKSNGTGNPIESPEPAGTPEEPIAVEIVGETENTNPTPPAVMQTEDFGQGSGPVSNQPLPPNSDTSNLNVPLYISGVTSGVGIAPIRSIGPSSLAGGGEIIFTSVPVGGTGGYGIDPALTNVQNGYSAIEFASQSSLVDVMPTIAIGVQGAKILSQIVGGYLNASGTADTYSGNMSAFWDPASVDAIDMINQYLEQHPEGFTDPFGNTVDTDFISEALATMIQSVFSEENFADGFSINELYEMMYENLLGWTDSGEIPYWRKLTIDENGMYSYPMTPYDYDYMFGNNSSTWMDPTEWRKAMYGDEGAGTINGDVDNSTNNGTIYNVQGDYVTNNYEAGYDTSNN